MGVRKDGILQVDDVGGGGGGTPVDITSPIGANTSANSVSVTLATDEGPIDVVSTPLDAFTTTEVLSSGNPTTASIPLGEYTAVTFSISGSSSTGSINFQVSANGSVWESISGYHANTSLGTPGIRNGFSPASIYGGNVTINVGGWAFFRITSSGLNGSTTFRISVTNASIPNLQFVTLVPLTGLTNTVTANAGTNLNTSTLATEATLALIKAKTDNIDVALSTRTKPADSQLVNAVNLDIRDLVFATDKVDVSGSSIDIAAVSMGNVPVTIDDFNIAIPVKPAVATAFAPTYVEGQANSLSVSLSGNLRTEVVGNVIVADTSDTYAFGIGSGEPSSALAIAGTDGVNSYRIITDTQGRLIISQIVNASPIHGTESNNASAPTSDNLGVLPAIATAATPTYVEGRLVGLSTDLAGNLRISGVISATNLDIRDLVFATDKVDISGSTNVGIKETRSATATETQVNDNAASVTILASNANRLGASIANDSTASLYLRMSSSAASLTVYSVILVTGAYYEVPFNYTGDITGIWASDPNTGAARVTEFA